MNSIPANPAYAELLVKFPPKVIRTEEENEHFIQTLYELESRHHKQTPAEREMADLLALLIEDFEDKHYQLPKAQPLEALSFLMDQHHLEPADLLDIFGSPSIASEVLNGKRELTKEHIKLLSERFHVSPEVFF